ncbi:MAG TPA: heparinase II/III family protein [Oscillospiraceae bacterium]|nr:heparinase II/III family protein [Oscillospiraceae bacterium]HPF55549.1 heparinase II/III family protein [Clostridiales bacterium]HPK35307.1 heparinase II/III family protein [Oscillospiraceae bacterium]HPR76934.1 heparinase II/III family protein [Oscillospiraceae bacterium]
MAYIQDYSALKQKIDQYDWAEKLYDKMKTGVDAFIDTYHDDINRRNGWGHNYICEKCGTGLKFDKDIPMGQPCPACGHINMGWRANDAWNTSYRGNANGNAKKAAILYKLTGDTKYLEYIKKVLTFYLENYQKLQVWVVHPMYLGRINGQHLSDDGCVISLLTAMMILGDELDEGFVTELGEKFFIPEGHFLKPFCYYINNIPVWDLCAIATIGIFYKQPDLIEYAFESEFGLINQVALGITKDYFWYEGSVHYHFYCIAPMTDLIYFAKSSGYQADCIDKLAKIIEKMYVMPAQMAFKNCMLPNPNDGWPFISMANFAGQYDVASASFDHPMIKWAATMMYDDRSPLLDHNGVPSPSRGGDLPRLLFGINPSDYDKYPREKLETRLWEDTDFAMLRDKDLEVFFKYGLIIASHSHFDIMNIEISAFGESVCYDLSTNGYGSFLFNWQQGTLSHCTVATDKVNIPKKNKGKLLEYDKDTAHIKALSEDAYPGVDYIRDLKLDNNTLHDNFTCTGKDGKPHTYDYFFHCLGEPEFNFEAKEVPPFTEKLYDTLQELKCYESDGDIKFSYKLPDKRVDITLKGQKDTKFYLFKGYAQTGKHFRWGIMARRNAVDTTFAVDYKFSKI